MPKGAQGQKRPADVIGNAVHVMRIATGEIAEDALQTGKEYARKGGLVSGPKRAAKLSKKRRPEIARKAARPRWAKARASKR
jgi:hypothetical protein